jgi:hypothetical protein
MVGRRKIILSWVALVLPVVAIFFVANAIVSRMDLPLYGTWTGLRPLEEKLERYRTVTQEGKADCIFLGSSLTESGCAVTEVNAQMDAHGDTRRFFNLAEGGAHLQTQLTVYRMSRLIHRPREVVVGVLIMGTDSDYYVDSDELPMRAMKLAPVGKYLRSDNLLRLSYEAWRQPLSRDAAPVRDLLLYGRFASRRFDYTDHHGRNGMGDLVSHVVSLDPGGAQQQAIQQRQRLVDMWERAGSVKEFLKREWPARLAVLRKIKALAQEDQARLVLYPVLTAYMAVHEDRVILDRANNIVKALARELDCEALPFPEASALLPCEMLDPAHFNRAGAEVLGARVGAALTGSKPAPRRPCAYPAPADYPRKGDVAWGSFTSVIKHPRKEGDILELVFKQGWNIPPWKDDLPMEVAVCLPGGRELRLRASPSDHATIRVNLQQHLTPEHDSIILISLLNAGTGQSLDIPLDDYRWMKSSVSIQAPSGTAN